jgi:hypothetical protein
VLDPRLNFSLKIPSLVSIDFTVIKKTELCFALNDNHDNGTSLKLIHLRFNIGNIPVGQWFPNNIRGKIRIRQKINNI